MPGVHVDIVPKGTTTSRRVVWDDISEVVRGGQAGAVEGHAQPQPMPPPQPQAQPQPQPEMAPEPEPEPQVTGALIHIDLLGRTKVTVSSNSRR